MYDWGDLAQHSAASYEIIRQAKATPEGERLTVVALGALTNVASALVIDPSIEANIELYWLGTQMNFDTGVMSHVDFNAMMDIRALHEMLNSKVPMTIIPVNVASDATFTMEETVAGLPMEKDISNYLIFNWFNHKDGGRKSRTLWDLALIEAILNPNMATIKPIKTSIDSGNRIINYYTSIDVDAMKKDFFKILSDRL